MNMNGGQSKISLTGLLMRDGTLYFAALLCFNTVVLALNNTPEVQFSPSGAFIDAFTGLLLCRFILNLRSFDLVDELHPTFTNRQFTSGKPRIPFLGKCGGKRRKKAKKRHPEKKAKKS